MENGFDMQGWLLASLFWLGVLTLVTGLWLLVHPASFLKAGSLLGRWVATDRYFSGLDRPRYQERWIYRHHYLCGGLILAGALYVLFMLVLQVQPAAVIAGLPVLINPFWSEWFYTAAYYLLLGANVLAVVAGMIVLVRPSLLKGIEQALNRWIDTERELKRLDRPYEISTAALTSRPRLFGLAVCLAGLYIMLSSALYLL